MSFDFAVGNIDDDIGMAAGAGTCADAGAGVIDEGGDNDNLAAVDNTEIDGVVGCLAVNAELRDLGRSDIDSRDFSSFVLVLHYHFSHSKYF